MLRRDNCRLKDVQEKSYGISQKFLIVATIVCDCLSLPSFSSSCFTNVCECVQASKWRLQKKGKPVRDPSYCSISPSNLEKLDVVSTLGGQRGVRPLWRFQSYISLLLSMYIEG